LPLLDPVLAGPEETEEDGGPALLSRCRGLLFCPNAAIDTLGAADLLMSILREDAPPSKTPVSISIHGCPAGCGFNCGVYEYTDLRIIGRRARAPVPDQELLALSPRLGALTEDCPSGALTASSAPGQVLDLDEGLCVKCGACLASDPSFRWPAPQESYASLELSGRRIASPRSFLAPRELVRRTDDLEGLFRKIASLVADFRKNAEKNEILSDFMDRAGLRDYFSESEGG
jgi:dissimilatory sulfite reductase (desulfoviridin) alpha/beta subunit